MKTVLTAMFQSENQHSADDAHDEHNVGTTGGLSCLGPSFRPELGTEPSMLLLLAAISVPVGKTMNSSVPTAG